MAAARPPRRPVLFLATLAASVAKQVDAARLDGVFARGASSSGASAGAASPTPAPAKKTQKDGSFRMALLYVDSVDVEEPMTLGEIRDILYRFDTIKLGVLSKGRSRTEVRRLLRDIRAKSDILNRFASLKENDGEVDDGGEVPPSRRNNICKHIATYDVHPDFQEDVEFLCKALDAVRSLILAGESVEVAVYEVSGRMNTLRMYDEYATSALSRGIIALLGEEWRWVTRRLEKRPSDPGAQWRSTSDLVEARGRALRSWVSDLGVHNTWKRPLKELHDFAKSVIPEEGNSLYALRHNRLRLELIKDEVIEYDDPYYDSGGLRQRSRDVRRIIKEKSDSLKAMVEQRKNAGEVDNVAALWPSQRTDVCTDLDAYGLPADLREEVQSLCQALDRMRKSTLGDGDPDVAFLEVAGRLMSLKSRPGYLDSDIAGELELAFAEEWHLHELEDTDEDLRVDSGRGAP